MAAALDVAVRKGLASTTVRDVAAEMGTSSGLIHHYFDSMDDVLAAAFERVAAAGPGAVGAADGRGAVPGRGAARVLPDLHPGRQGLGVPAVARRLGRGGPTAGRAGHVAAAQPGVAGAAGADDPRRGRDGSFACRDPAGAAWRILSLLDGLALQVVAHGTTITRDEVVAWATGAAEMELGLAAGRWAPVLDRGRRTDGDLVGDPLRACSPRSKLHLASDPPTRRR